MSMNFNWNFAQPTNGQAAFDAAQAALQNKRNNVYTQNMDNRTAGNANDMMAWMQQGNDAATYQQQQAAAAEQQAIAAEQQAQQEAAQKQAQIDSIKSRIKELESQIAANQSKLKNWSGIDGQIAALEARKINTQDPTSVWRWKQTQEQAMQTRREDMERVKAEKEVAKELTKRQVNNKVTNTLGTINIGLNTTPEQVQQYRNTLASLMTEAQNAGIEDLSPITKMIERLNEVLPYEQMTNLKEQMDLYNKNFESVAGEGTYGSNKDYATYIKNLDDIWYQASPEMRRDRDFRMAYETAKAARAPKKKNKPKFRRK